MTTSTIQALMYGQLSDSEKMILRILFSLEREVTMLPVGDSPQQQQLDEIKPTAMEVLFKARKQSDNGEAFSTPIRGKEGQTALLKRLKAENQTS